MQCPNPDAKSERNKGIYTCLEDLEREKTSKHILTCLENNLTSLLHIDSMNKYGTTCPQDSTLERTIKDASHHQTIIGWENSLRGYTSKYGAKVRSTDKTNTVDKRKHAPWTTTLIRGLINLHKTIWNTQNTHINGNTIRETHQKL